MSSQVFRKSLFNPSKEWRIIRSSNPPSTTFKRFISTPIIISPDDPYFRIDDADYRGDNRTYITYIYIYSLAYLADESDPMPVKNDHFKQMRANLRFPTW
jgi:hypothetical protein